VGDKTKKKQPVVSNKLQKIIKLQLHQLRRAVVDFFEAVLMIKILMIFENRLTQRHFVKCHVK